jgi:hypothetical protein
VSNYFIKYIPKHLMDKYNQFASQMGSGLINDVTEGAYLVPVSH